MWPSWPIWVFSTWNLNIKWKGSTKWHYDSRMILHLFLASPEQLSHFLSYHCLFSFTSVLYIGSCSESFDPLSTTHLRGEALIPLSYWKDCLLMATENFHPQNCPLPISAISAEVMDSPWCGLPMGSSSTSSAQSHFPHSLVDFVAKSTLQWISCKKVSVRETVFWELNLRHLIDLPEFHFCLHDSISFCCLQSNAVMTYYSSGYFHYTIFLPPPIYWVPTIWHLKITLQCSIIIPNIQQI